MKKNWLILSVVLVAFLGSYSVQADLNYEYYEDDGSWPGGGVLPDFDSLTPVKTGTEIVTPTDPNAFRLNEREQEENIGFRFTGYIQVATTGDYTFYTNSDDGSKLYIGNSLVVDNDGSHGMTERSGSINLTAGKHAITVLFAQGGGPFDLEVYYAGPAIAKTRIPHSVLSLSSDQASYPLPDHEARGVNPDSVQLEWQPPTSAPGATYNIYFGTDPDFTSPAVETNYSGTTYVPSVNLARNNTYYWRIDVFNPPTTGNRWSFSTERLIAYYKFEGDPNDSSGNEHHGALQNGAQIVVDPVRGSVLNLDGTDDFMNLVNPKTAAELGLGGNNPKSMTAWVYTRSFNDGGIFDVGNHSDGQEFCLRTMTNDNTWRIQYHGGAYDIDFIADSKDKWVHFALVHDGAYTRMYVNGIIKTQAPRVLNTSGGDTFRVGQYGGTSFDGLIDEFALWDFALSPEQVRSLMPAGDYDADGDVDALDLKTLTDDWLADNATPILPSEILDNMETYQPGGMWPVPGIFSWFQFFNEDCLASSGTASTLLEPNEIPQGDQALRIDFNYPTSCDGGGDWIMVGKFLKVPPDNWVYLAQYDEIRFWKRNHGAGHEDIKWEFILGSNYPSGTITDEHMVARIGPFSSTEDPNEWHEVVVDLRNGDNVSWESPYGSIDDVIYVHGILITAISDVGSGESGQISVDVDDFRLLDYTTGCSANPAADLNGDCKLDLKDFAIQAANFLKEPGL